MKAHALKTVSNPSSAPGMVRETRDAPDKPGKITPNHDLKPGLPGIAPANEPFIGLISGVAPDPTIEIAPEPEPDFPDYPGQEGETLFRKLNLEKTSIDTGNRYIKLATHDGEPVATVSNMSEEDFIEFWAFDVWDALSAACLLFRLDISEIETGEDDEEAARKAAKVLYRMALRRPKWFGWMISENTVEGGDWMACVAFFGGKAAAVYAGVKLRRMEKKKARQIEDTTTPFLPGKGRARPDIKGEAQHAS